jgi:diguanylate cyclase (GGDEF)-like protein
MNWHLKAEKDLVKTIASPTGGLMNSSRIDLCAEILKLLSRSIQARLQILLQCSAFCIAALCLALSSLPAAGMGNDSAEPKLPLILDRPSGIPPSRFPFHSYGADSGLGNLAVRRITQDSVGLLWIGTEDGLYRYDADRFTRFDFNNGLPSTWINDVLATPEGDLWVCTPQGLAVRSGNGFKKIESESGGLPEGSCQAVVRDARGAIWVAHKSGLYYQRNQRFHRLEGFPSGPVSAIVSIPGRTSSIFAATKGVVVHVIENRIVASLSQLSSSTDPIDSLAADSSGRIWAQSARKLFCLLPGADSFRDESSQLPAISSRGVLTTDRSGRLWVPTDEGISCRIGEKWQNFGPSDGLPTDWARFVFEDREGSLWIASVGLHRLVGRGSWASWTRAQGLPSDTVWDIYRSKRGDLWVATDRGLCLATSNGWRVLPGTERTVIRNIHEDSLGRLWLSLVPAAILRYDPAAHRLFRYDTSLGVAGVRVLSVEEDGEGQLWAATDGAGLLRYRPEKNDFMRTDVPGGTPEETFRCLLRDSHGRLWATGQYGLLLRNGGQWRRFSKKDGLLRDHVSYIVELRSGELCLSYFEPLGIIRFKVDSETLQILGHYDQKNGLSSDKVYLIGEDLKNNLWVGTGKGLDVISPAGVLHFSREDGVAGDDIDAMAILVDTNNGLFIGTSSGLSLYRADTNLSRIEVPKPVFLSATLGDNQLVANTGTVAKYPYPCKIFHAEFAVLSYLYESQIECEVRLRGLEKEWHSARVREARYPALGPGSYVYEARSRIGSGPWSSPASIAFEIQPAWWMTWPALFGGLILLAAAVFALFRWRLQHFHNRTRQLERLVSARTNELAIANADLERLSITDPLTGLKNRRYLEFSIAEDLARARRRIQAIRSEWSNNKEEIASISFLLIDIDHFKLVNDNYGHAAGDHVLRQMGSVLSSVTRESDTTVRWGGEEFLIIARGSKENDAGSLAERIRKKVALTPFSISNEKTITLTCSIGFSSWPFFNVAPESLGWQEILSLSDRCLYLAKNNGRNAWIGITARPEYKGDAGIEVLDDFCAAEADGIVSIQMSFSTDTKNLQFPIASYDASVIRTVS